MVVIPAASGKRRWPSFSLTAVAIGAIVVAACGVRDSEHSMAATPTAEQTSVTGTAAWWQLDDRLDASGTVVGHRLSTGSLPDGKVRSFDFADAVVAFGPVDSQTVYVRSASPSVVHAVTPTSESPRTLAKLEGTVVAGIGGSKRFVVLVANARTNQIDVVALDAPSQKLASFDQPAGVGPGAYALVATGDLEYLAEFCGLGECHVWHVASGKATEISSPYAWWFGIVDGKLVGLQTDASDSAIGSIVTLTPGAGTTQTVVDAVSRGLLVECGVGPCLVAEQAAPHQLLLFRGMNAAPTILADLAPLESRGAALELLPRQPATFAGIEAQPGEVWIGLDGRVVSEGRVVARTIRISP